MSTFAKRVIDYVGASVGVAILTAAIQWLRLDATAGNVPILYLLVVTLSALFAGRGAAVWASICSFLAINWFFVTPRYTFIVQEPTEWLTLYMFLFTAVVTGQLMALLKRRASEASQRQLETAALAEASLAVASQLDSNSALVEVLKQVAKVVDLKIAEIVTVQNGERQVAAVYPARLEKQAAAALFTPEQDKNGSAQAIDLPIEINENTLGTLSIRLNDGDSLSAEKESIITSLVHQAAVVLQREGLMKAQAQAAALADADRLKTALLSMVTHDFRSPLTAIKASVSTLLTEGQPLEGETQRGLYQAIELETDRLNRMVGNILDLSRLEAGAWRPKVEPTPVTELVGMVLDQFSGEANERITVKLDPTISDILVDSVQMVQVVKNLVENSLKYSPPDSVVEIDTKAGDSTIVIEVLDRGRGLSGEELSKIFEPFYRGDGLKESAVPGVGIGLAVCKGLVEAHGGRLSACNREGGGSIFRIALPEQPIESASLSTL